MAGPGEEFWLNEYKDIRDIVLAPNLPEPEKVAGVTDLPRYPPRTDFDSGRLSASRTGVGLDLSATSSNNYPYTFTDSFGDKIVCASETVTEVDGITVTGCAGASMFVSIDYANNPYPYTFEPGSG
ncbi:hypothetical protein N7488_008598 [Penicillium malachiteum]|nr:hypothetical protein N7488_008598 [Penicillium malachiteum]